MATIRDLAKYTGFSVTTISRVLNNDPTLNVTDNTRVAILEAADELHYSLPKTRRSHRNRPVHIAIVEMMSLKEQLADPYYLYLKNYVVRHCMERGCNVSYLFEQSGKYQMLEKIPLDGILAVGIFSEQQIEQLQEISSAVVFVDSAPDEQRFDSVVLNFKLGVEQALEHLLSKGHRKIGFLGPAYKLDQKKRPALESRRQYFKEYMEKIGLYEEKWMVDTGLTMGNNKEQMKQWLEPAGDLPTAFLAYNEESAITALSALHEAGFRVPEDVSIISFNDTPLSILTEPPLTSVTVHLEVMGEAAVKMILERIEDPQHLPYKIVLPPTLTERSSVAELRDFAANAKS